MAFIPCLNTAEVSFVFDIGGHEARCVMGVQSSIGWTLPSLQALGTKLVDVILSDTLNWVNVEWTLTKLHIVDLTTASSPAFDWVTGSSGNLPQIGTSSITGGGGAQMALVTTLRTASRGRSFRGRNYWPGLCGNNIGSDGRTVVGTRALDQNDFVGSVVTGVATITGLNVVVISRHSGGSPRSAGVMSIVTSWDTNDTIDTQRRRVAS